MSALSVAVIGLDLGGTKLAGAVFTRAGRLLCKNVVPLAGRKGRAVGELICHEVTRLLAAARSGHLRISAVGVSVPGISHAKTGKVWAPNIPGWKDYPLRRELMAAIKAKHISIAIDSDRACYILGETWRGAAEGCRNAIFLAVGTGIGAGVLIDGRILRGAHDIAGAIGWLALDRPFRREYMSCGCLEHHASGAGLAKVARELAARKAGEGKCYRDKPLQGYNGWTAQEVFAAYERGDVVAKEVIGQAVEFWGMAVANLVSLFNPEKIIFGGGVFGPGARLLGAIYAEAKKWAQPISIKQVRVRASKLGGDAGLYGAGCLALQAAE
jgi:glucokinase